MSRRTDRLEERTATAMRAAQYAAQRAASLHTKYKQLRDQTGPEACEMVQEIEDYVVDALQASREARDLARRANTGIAAAFASKAEWAYHDARRYRKLA
jgi:hypothetical protein